MFWNTWTSFIFKVKPWHQFHKIMKLWREKVKPWDPFHKSSCRPFFLSVTGKMKPMKPILHKLWNHEEKKWNHENNLDTRFIGLFYVTQWGFNRNLLYFFLFFRQLSRETGWNCLVLVSHFFGSKMKLAVVSWFYGAKIMKPSGSVGKKMKLTTRGFP